MRCTGNCSNCRICSVKITDEYLLKENQKPTEGPSNFLEVTPEEEEGASRAFDMPITDLAVVDKVEYELKKNIFGKDVVKKVR